jgi:hypothetical protein
MNHLHRLIQTAAITAPFLAASIACAGVAIRYDSCGFRSLEWDAVAGAATYKVERRVCDGCVGEWRLVAQTPTTQANDADEPSLEYRVRALGAAGNIISNQSATGDGRQVHRLAIAAGSDELPSVACGEQLRLAVDAEVPAGQGTVIYEWRGNGVTIATTVTPYVELVTDAALSGAVFSVVATNGCGTVSRSWQPYVITGMPHGTVVRWASLFHERYTYERSSQQPNCYMCCGGLPPGSCECSSCRHEETHESRLTNTPCDPLALSANGAIMTASASNNNSNYYHGGVQYDSTSYQRENWCARGLLAHPAKLQIRYSLRTHYLVTESDCTPIASVDSVGTTVWSINGSSPHDGNVVITLNAGSFDIRVEAGGCSDPWGAPGGVSADLEVELTFLPPDVDCNANLRPDASDISSGTSVDIDSNGVPDECQTLSVPGQYATIQAAIDAAPSNELRIVSVAAGTYPGPVAFNGKPVIVRGAEAASTVITGNGGQPLSVVRFTGGEPAITALERVTVRGGTTGTPIPSAPQYLVGGGIFGIDTAASVRDCVVEQNAAGFGGGAYFLRSTGEVLRTVFRNNGAGSDGGGFQSNQGSQRLTDVIIDGNACSSRGGGMHLVQGRPTLTRVTVRNNHSNDMIGGISWYALGSAAASAMVDDCVVTGNSALVAQGGIGISAPATGTPTISLRGTDVCGSTPQPNISGAWTDLGGNRICDCAGDLNGDRRIDGGDIGMLLSSWGYCGSTCPSDINRDGKVNGADLGLLLSGWGSCGG